MGNPMRSMILGLLTFGLVAGSCGVRTDEATPALETIIPTTIVTTTIQPVASATGDEPVDLPFTDSTPQREIAPALAENPDVSSDGILLAAIILATGDIDIALQQGLVTESEIDAAVVAIETDSLDVYLSGVAGE